MNEISRNEPRTSTQEDIEKAAKLFPIYEAADTQTARVKSFFRELACGILDIQRNAKTPEAKRSASIALTELETASMYAVKAIHQG